MKLIVCIDERRGMMFHHRRQSRDRILIADLLEYIGNRTLCFTAYSAPLFADGTAHTRTITALTELANAEYCFVEDLDPVEVADTVDEIVLYHWNRHYPADRYFQMDMRAFSLTDSKDFVGSSHEKITREVWKK